VEGKWKNESMADADIQCPSQALPSSSCVLAVCSRCHSETSPLEIAKEVRGRLAKLGMYLAGEQ